MAGKLVAINAAPEPGSMSGDRRGDENRQIMESSEDFSERAAAFQKIWTDSMSKMMQAAFTMTPNSAPPEVLREIRNGILQALAEAWNEFLRSQEFQEGMKQWMDNAVAFRKLSNDFMSKVRQEIQAPSREDIDTIVLAVRHMETRVLDRLVELEKQMTELNGRGGGPGLKRRGKAARGKAPKRPRSRARPAPG